MRPAITTARRALFVAVLADEDRKAF